MVNPPGTFTLSDLLEDCKAVTGAEVEPVWVSAEFLASHEAGPGTGVLPCWHGSAETGRGNSTARALAAGMHHRPERETARDILTWWDTLPEERTSQPRAGLAADKEAEILAAWKESQS
jgi:2'-hydroxyisoflavone reductase